jgi:polysaccharide biosynthesis PFTS motif protein
VWNQKEYNIFLHKIYESLLKKSDYEIIYKSKKIRQDLYKKFTNENKIIFNKILKCKNFTYIEGDNKKITTYQIISISHLVVSAPVSSIITETLNANKKILVFDPTKKYKTKNFFITKFNEFYCNDENNFMNKLITLDKISKKRISKRILNNFVLKKLGLKQFGLNSQNLLKILINEL